jgi:hypothetical protein
MVLEISWIAWLELQSRRPTKQGRSVEGGTGVGLANEPPMV